VNDGYGHATGDTVLRGVARACQGAIRVTDILGRYGGEEFAAVLHETDLAGALVAAERMRAKVEALAVETAQGPLRVTISLGVAESAPEHALGPELGRADAALDRAKETGRNRVCSAEP
jgi:two-component system cell cycle response regulator